MKERNFMKMVKAKWPESSLCVGLDTDPEKISDEIKALIRKEDNLPPSGSVGPLMLGFNKRLIRATKDLVCAYKPNLGFYLAQGLQGLWALEETVWFSHDVAPDVPVILDSKSGDIGSSAAQYAKFAFDVIGADAVTVNPWGGRADGIDSFLKYADKGIFVWCRGSNEGSREIQDTEIIHPYPGGADQPLYQMVAELISGFMDYGGFDPEYGWNINSNCGLVVGVNKSDPLAIQKARWAVGDIPILVPGIGAQGGDLEKAVKDAIYTDPETGEKSFPAIINSSRGILYKSSGPDFAEAAREEAKRLRDEINKYRQEAMGK